MFKEYWSRLPIGWQTEIISISHTAFTAMVVELGFQLSHNGNLIPTGQEALIAIGVAVLRSAQKAVVLSIVAQLKGDQPPIAPA